MRTLLAIALAALLTLPAAAATKFTVLPPDPGDPNAGNYGPPAKNRYCPEVKFTYSNPAIMIAAARFYFYGFDDGHSCIKVDYAAALDHLRKASDLRDLNAMLAELRKRAKAGDTAAAAALASFGK